MRKNTAERKWQFLYALNGFRVLNMRSKKADGWVFLVRQRVYDEKENRVRL